MRPVQNMLRIARRSMFIQAEITPNMDSIKFKPGKPVTGSTQTHEFLDRSQARASPLASSLFRIEGIHSVMFGKDFITVTKDQESPWQLLKPDIYGAIMDFYSSVPLIHAGTGAGQAGFKDDDRCRPGRQ